MDGFFVGKLIAPATLPRRPDAERARPAAGRAGRAQPEVAPTDKALDTAYGRQEGCGGPLQDAKRERCGWDHHF